MGGRDRPEKAVRADEVADRLADLGGTIGDAEIPGVQVYGHPRDVVAGPSVFGADVTTGYGFDVPRDPRTLLELGDDLVSGLGTGPVRDVYAEVLRKARWKTVDHQLAPESSGPALPKLLSLTAVTG